MLLVVIADWVKVLYLVKVANLLCTCEGAGIYGIVLHFNEGFIQTVFYKIQPVPVFFLFKINNKINTK